MAWEANAGYGLCHLSALTDKTYMLQFAQVTRDFASSVCIRLPIYNTVHDPMLLVSPPEIGTNFPPVPAATDTTKVQIPITFPRLTPICLPSLPLLHYH